MSMKKIIPILLILLLLAGCKIETDIRPDTIVDIPLEPTEDVTEPPTEEVTEATEPPTEAPTEAPTEPPTEKATEKPTEKTQSSSKGSSGNTSSKKPSSGSSSKKDKTTKATESTKPTEPPTEAPTKAPEKPSGTYSPTKLDKAITAAINEQRAEAGLPALSASTKVSPSYTLKELSSMAFTVTFLPRLPDLKVIFRFSTSRRGIRSSFICVPPSCVRYGRAAPQASAAPVRWDAVPRWRRNESR